MRSESRCARRLRYVDVVVSMEFAVEECVDFLDQRKQAKMQWIQVPSRSNVDNLNNIRRDASRHFRNKKKAYMKVKIAKVETNSKIKNVRNLYRGINDLKKGYQPRTTIVKDEIGDFMADSHSILWRDGGTISPSY